MTENPASAPNYFVAPDGHGDVALWRGTGTDDDNCHPVVYRYTLDAQDSVLWPTLVAALVDGGAR